MQQTSQHVPSSPPPPTLVLRHRKENLKKCSLRGLETRDDFRFYTYPQDVLPDLEGYIMLAIDAPPLTTGDAGLGLLVIDATWRYAGIMIKQIAPQTEHVIKRSLPSHYRTAYPRRQDDCPMADCGLASIEAIFLAHHLLGMPTDGLLDNYHWKEQFLAKNGF
jgi:pre-rRNA-processing protein TSR3